MANKKFLLGILVLALVFGMTVVGCQKEDSTGDNDENAVPKGTSVGIELGSKMLGIMNNSFYLTLASNPSSSSLSWKSDITGTDVISWLDIQAGRGDNFVGLQVDSVTATTISSGEPAIEIIISYASKEGTITDGYSSEGDAKVSIKNTALNAIMAKINNGVEPLKTDGTFAVVAFEKRK